MAVESNQSPLEVAKKYVELLHSKKIAFEAVLLFGSAVNGGFNEDSDIDIAVVMQDVPNRFFMELDLARYRHEIDLRIEPHILTVEEAESPFWFDLSKSIRLA